MIQTLSSVFVYEDGFSECQVLFLEFSPETSSNVSIDFRIR